ncbi:unnamed protein product [Coregonus sp. 'balchen']|nr:unnamed protein product [Coregonus sp. 'balchen']
MSAVLAPPLVALALSFDFDLKEKRLMSRREKLPDFLRTMGPEAEEGETLVRRPLRHIRGRGLVCFLMLPRPIVVGGSPSLQGSIHGCSVATRQAIVVLRDWDLSKTIQALYSLMDEDDERSVKVIRNLLASWHNVNIALITVRRQLKKLEWKGLYHSAHLMKLHMEQIQTLKTRDRGDQQKEKHSMRAEIRATADALVQSQAALTERKAVLVEKGEGRDGVTIHARHTCARTPPPTGRGNYHGWFVRSSVHPDISIPLLTPELDELLTKHSKGRPYRYAIPRMCN